MIDSTLEYLFNLHNRGIKLGLLNIKNFLNILIEFYFIKIIKYYKSGLMILIYALTATDLESMLFSCLIDFVSNVSNSQFCLFLTNSLNNVFVSKCPP